MAGCRDLDSPPRNLLLLTVDTLRADHLSSFGYERQTSPAVDRLAGRGVLFSNAFVQRGGTWASMTSILSSLYPRTHGVRTNGDLLSPSVTTIAERLQKRGFRTSAILANMLNARHPGFDEVLLLGEDARNGRDETATRRSLRWLRAHRDEKFFLWLHLMGPHVPYAPAPEFHAKYDTGYRGPLGGTRDHLLKIHAERRELSSAEFDHIISLYDGAIAEVDAQVGRVLAALDELDLTSETLVVFASDHGEELYGHYAYFLHSWSIYDTVLKIPLIFSSPGQLPEGARLGDVVESVDLAPTIFELLGLPIPEIFEGRSLVPLITGNATDPAEPRAAFAELGPHIQSVRTDRWHYIYNPRGLSSPGARSDDTGRRGVFEIANEELYDVHTDPEQLHNVVGAHPEVAEELRRRVLQWSGPTADPYRAGELTPAARAELEALGYLD